MNKTKNLVWIDLEMTGLLPASDRIIEIATIVTDENLNLIAEGLFNGQTTLVVLVSPTAI